MFSETNNTTSNSLSGLGISGLSSLLNLQVFEEVRSLFPVFSQQVPKTVDAPKMPPVTLEEPAQILTLPEVDIVKQAVIQAKSRSPLIEGAIKVDRVVSEKKASLLVTGPSLEYLYAVSDIPGAYRMVENLVDVIRKQPSSPSSAALGIMSGASVITGYVTASRGYVAYKKAQEIQDYWGKVIGKVQVSRGGFETASGLAVIPFRALTIAATITSAKATAVAATVLGAAAFSLLGVTYVLMGVPSAITVYHASKFKSELKKAMNFPDEAQKLKSGLMFLMSQLELTNEEKGKLARNVSSALEKGKTLEEVKIPAEDAAFLTEWDQAFIQGFVDTKYFDKDDIYQASVQKQIEQSFIQSKKRKEAILERNAGGESVALLKKEMQKPERESILSKIQKSKTREEAINEAKQLIDHVQANMKSKILWNAAFVALTFFGAAIFTASIIFSGGILAIAFAASIALVAIAMLAIDGYYLYQALKTKQPAEKDKVLMAAGNFLMLTALILNTVFSAGLVPLIATSVIGAVWLSTAGYTAFKWKTSTEEDKETLLDPELKEDLAQEA